MSKLFNWAAARIVAAFALALPLAAMAIDYTGTDYEPWSYSAGCVAWRATESLFHASTVVDVPADGTIVEGDAYAFDTGHPWQVFASNQSAYSAPGKVLVYDVAGKTAASDARFAPLSFGGMWVKVLQAEGVPYSITDDKTDSTDRKVELGATGTSTYFKFDESFTFDRNSATKVLGTATVEIASGKTFTINQRAGKGAAVDAGNTLVLKGEGTLAVVAGLSVSGTLDLSAATVPTISGDVTLAGGSTIKLPENTVIDATHPFTVCTGTLSSSGDVVYVKIGGGDPVKAFVTVSDGAITAVSTLATYSATIDGDTVFSNIAWEKDGQAATIADMSIAILEISGSGVVTGLASAPAKVTLAAGVTLDVTSIPAADFAAIVKSTSGTYRWTANHPPAVPQNYTYEFVGGATDADQVSVECVAPYFNNSGYLKTSGYIAFTNFWSGYTTSTLDVLSGKTSIGASNDKALRGTVTVRASAELVNSRTADALAYGASTTVNVYGALTMGSTRWTVGSNNTINMYGGTITGEGQSSNGALDFISGSSLNVNETCEITASVRFRDALTPVTVAAEKTLTLSGTIRVYNANGGVSKRGAGNLTFTTDPNNLPRGIEHQDGHLVFSTQDDVTITNTYDTAATDTRSLWYARQSNWKGTVKVAGLTGNLTWLTGAGNANSTISLQNVDNAYVIAAANSTYAIPGTVSIDGVTVFNNGSSGSTMSISNLTGSSQLVLAGWDGCSSVRYNLLNVDADWAGTLVVSNGITRTQGGTLTIGIGNIESANTNPGACVLPITNVALENTTGSVVYNLDNATLNGAAADLEVKSDGVYVRNNVTISVPVVANTTIEVSVGGTPVAPATEGESTNTYSVVEGSTVTVTYSSDDYEVTGGTFEFAASENYTVDAAGVTTAPYVAQIKVGVAEYEKYTSVAQALTSENVYRGITLLGNATEGTLDITQQYVMLTGAGYTLTADITVGASTTFVPYNVTLDGDLTVNGIYNQMGTVAVTGDLTTGDGARLQFSTLGTDVAALTVGGDIAVNGALTLTPNSTSGLTTGVAYKTLNGATVTLAEGASVTLGTIEGAILGYVVEPNETTTLTIKIPAAKVGEDDYHDTFASARAAAAGVGVITLLKDVSSVVTNYNTQTGYITSIVTNDLVTIAADEVLKVNANGYVICVGLAAGLTPPEYALSTVMDGNVAIYSVLHGVAVIGNEPYPSLADAFANAQDGDTITVLTNNTLTGGISVTNNTLTLDLNGFTVTGAAGTQMFQPQAGASFTITDMSEGKAGKAVSASKIILTGEPCAFTLEAGTLESDEVPVWIWNNGTSGTRSVTINGGKLIGRSANTGEGGDSCISNDSGTINMTDGEIESACNGLRGNIVDISGGKVSVGAGFKVFYYNNSSQRVTGGTYNQNVGERCAAGYAAYEKTSGWWTVSEVYVEGQEVRLYGTNVTITASQAAWLKKCGDKTTVGNVLENLAFEQFSDAYLLNLNILAADYQHYEKGDFIVTDFHFETENEKEYVVVGVSLERHGALGGINGTLKLTGTADLGVDFVDISETPVDDDDFSDDDIATWRFIKGDKKFFKPVIE